MLSDRQFIQYSRQIMLPELGEQGVEKLQASKVTVIGAGGLGSLVCHQLAASGIGQLQIFDNDKVELSNLPRQLIYRPEDINQLKVKQLAKHLACYPDCKISVNSERVTANNYQDFLPQFSSDIILDCTDNFLSRKLINQVALSLTLPLVSASISQYESQILCIDKTQQPDSGCYQCILPPDINENQNCSTLGVMGSLVGVIASMQTWLAQQYLLNLNFPAGKLLRFDAIHHHWLTAQLNQNPYCSSCSQ